MKSLCQKVLFHFYATEVHFYCTAVSRNFIFSHKVSTDVEQTWPEDKKINQQNAQINPGLIYYWSITPTCFGPSVEAIIREFEIVESYKAIVLIC